MDRDPVLAADEDVDARSEPWGAGHVIAGKYRLERRVGEGGMGDVWLATNVALETSVALKLIRRDAQDVSASSRLLREARAAAQLRHPAIVRVFDFGECPRCDAFIVMELLEGVSLRDHLNATGPLAAETAASILLPIVDGVAAAHERGIAHRDLKPENILLARDDTGRVQPKVVDFGLAKVVRGEASGARTMTAVAGTPHYMSPEQAMQLDGIDPFRVDVWALGVVLYEMLTDAFVFDGESPRDVLEQVVRNVPPPLLGVGGVDEALSAIVARAMAKDPDARWPSARELRGALGDWLLDRGVTVDVHGTAIGSSRPSRPHVAEPSAPPAVEPPRDYAPAPAAPDDAPGSSTPPTTDGDEVLTRLTPTLPCARPRWRRRAGVAAVAGVVAVVATIAIFAQAARSEVPPASKLDALVAAAAARVDAARPAPPAPRVETDIAVVAPRAPSPPTRTEPRSDRASSHALARSPASKKPEDVDLGF